jgi:3-dehydroquinate dehydratase type I
MNLSSPAVVVSLPARTISDARKEMEEASRSGADLIEIRFDRFRGEEIARVGELFPTPLPLVATVRSRAEGGEGPDDPEARLRILSDLARHPFRWIDAEAARDFPSSEAFLRPGVCGLIVSSHATTPIRESEWKRLLRQRVPRGTIRKVVAAAPVGQLLRELIPSLPPPGESPLVALTTGPSGPLLRAWSRRFRFPLVYASLPERTDRAWPPPVEPSQIPVDRLRAYLDAEGNPPLFAIVGRPVGHSRSPAIHSRWMRESGRAGLFVALEFESDKELVESVPSLIEGGFRGLSVTHPFKEVALHLATQVGPGALACGVANTLSFDPEGVEAENTDLVAILRRLEELRLSGRWDGSSLGVIGAGGAARATLAATRSLGVESHVWARRPEASDLLAHEFGAHPVHGPRQARPPLVVHATTIGRAAGESPSLPDLDWLRPGIHVIDWVYAPDDPITRLTAEKAGATYEDGSRLLVYQAAAAYGIWWGDGPTSEQTSAALEGVS